MYAVNDYMCDMGKYVEEFGDDYYFFCFVLCVCN